MGTWEASPCLDVGSEAHDRRTDQNVQHGDSEGELLQPPPPESQHLGLLIVLGSEGKTRMEHALLGSVSEEVLRHANRTVLVVAGHRDGKSPGRGNKRLLTALASPAASGT